MSRDDLAARQAALLDALLAGGQAPPGFDADRLDLQARMLVAKRRGVLAKRCPELVDRLGEEFAALAEEYCRDNPRRTAADRGDAEAFHDWLAGRGLVPARRRQSFFRRKRRRIGS
ncbi:HvfC/BufC family peptide modification chaperone [Saccharopolyspora rosea]|uniref:DNA-binding domain-containing protein n=1 Tax=Saccharopolyspora rosea TaxID=524884 RepID=A0ABW3FWG1_9PSEU|nr:putative DNA-binding domain-containing protein [Saccharopolyspora rosea]